MSRKTLTAAAVVMLMLTAGCSVFERVVYRPDINQGNYLTVADVAKIHTGMTKQQVAYTLGTSMMKDPFGSNIWYYIFRRESGYDSVTQQTLTLTFNSSDILTHIDNKPILEGPSILPISSVFSWQQSGKTIALRPAGRSADTALEIAYRCAGRK